MENKPKLTPLIVCDPKGCWPAWVILTSAAATLTGLLWWSFGGPWLRWGPLTAVEFVATVAATLYLEVACLGHWINWRHYWLMEHDPAYRRRQEQWKRELAEFMGESEWMVDATRELKELAKESKSRRKGADGVERGWESRADGVERGPELRVVSELDRADG